MAAPPPPRRGHTTSDKLRSADTTAIHKILWPHELIFTPEGQSTTCESLSVMAFVKGFLTIMSLQKDALRIKMGDHLQEMMEDGETFGWPMVGAYHAVWLQYLEQGKATWNNEATRLKLCRSLVWHRIAPRH